MLFAWIGLEKINPVYSPSNDRFVKKLLTASSWRTGVEFMVRVWGPLWGSLMVWGPLPVFNQGSGDIYSGKGSYCPESVFINPTPQYSLCVPLSSSSWPQVLLPASGNVKSGLPPNCWQYSHQDDLWIYQSPHCSVRQVQQCTIVSSSRPHFPFNTCFYCL